MLRVLLADHNSLARVGMRTALESVEDMVLLDEACDSHNLEQLCGQLNPNVLVLNINLPDLQFEKLKNYLNSNCLSTKILLRIDRD